MRGRIFGLSLTLILSACTRTVYVPQTRTEYEYRERVDSLYIRDSVFVSEKQKGDTVLITQYKERVRERVVLRYDTIVKVDSISYPVEVVKTEYRTPGIVRVFAIIGLLSVVVVVAVAITKIKKAC